MRQSFLLSFLGELLMSITWDYTITWLLCAFSLVVDRDLLKDKHTEMAFFVPPKSFNKPFKFLLYKTKRLHFPVRTYCNRSQKTSQRVKNSHSRLRLVSYFFCSLHAVTSSGIYYSTHARTEKCYLFVKYYTVARRYGFYDRGQRRSEILLLSREHNIHIFELPGIMFYTITWLLCAF